VKSTNGLEKQSVAEEPELSSQGPPEKPPQEFAMGKEGEEGRARNWTECRADVRMHQKCQGERALGKVGTTPERNVH